MNSFVEHEWQFVSEDGLGERTVEKCPHCNMVKSTVEGETGYRVPANTPSRWKQAIIPPGSGWPEPTCKSDLRALAMRLKARKDSQRDIDLVDAETCCVSWKEGMATLWECGGPGICDCECHHVEIGITA